MVAYFFESPTKFQGNSILLPEIKDKETTTDLKKVCKRLFSELGDDVSQSKNIPLSQECSKKAKINISSPQKYYPFEKKSNGRIFAQLTPSAKKKRNVIYKIKNLKSNKNYTGKTAQEFAKRAYSHHYGINHPEKDFGGSDLYQAIRENPHQFVIGIQLEQSNMDVSLEKLEKYCIDANESFSTGYNKNKGGGGGTAAQKSSASTSTPKLTREQTRTPTKSYPLDYSESGKIQVILSPNAKASKGVIYGFKNIKNGKWLIGETERKVCDRISGYHYQFNHPEKDCGQLPLPCDVRSAPNDFRFYILDSVAGDFKGLEKAWIKAKNSYRYGYNQNRGGGGSSFL